MRLRILPHDGLVLLGLSMALVLVIGVAVLLRRHFEPAFSPRGWKLFFKIHAILGLVMVLVLTESALEPADMFIYGKF